MSNTPAINPEPWFIPTDEKVRLAKAALASGKKLAIALYPASDSTLRYRCYNVMRSTESSSEWYSVFFLRRELKAAQHLLPQAQLLILARMEWENDLEDAIVTCRRLHLPVVYDIDDRICHLSYLKLALNTVNPPDQEQGLWFQMVARYQMLAELCDGFIATNDLLGQELQRTFGKPYQVIPNSFNAEQLAASNQALATKSTHANQFTLGYFSGTASHANDFRLILPEVIQFMYDYPDINLQIVGDLHLPPINHVHEFAAARRINFLPVTDFISLQQLICNVDVNLVPLWGNIFTDCKSELKFFEASLVKTPTVASPGYTYAQAIQSGHTGFLCQPGEWYDTLVKLYRQPQLRQEIAQSAHQYCLEHYSPAAILTQIEQAYDFYAK